MQKATDNHFSIAVPSFHKREPRPVSPPAAFYQQLVAGLVKTVYDTQGWAATGRRLITLAEHALNLKATETVEQISHVLANAPLPAPYQSIAHYYQVFCRKRRGEIEPARAGFARLADASDLPLPFRARAIQALGISYAERGHFEEAVRYFAEAMQAASIRQGNDLQTTVNAQSMMAVYASLQGDHQGAVHHLESLGPLVHTLATYQPLIRYSYINNLAVELAEVGRLEEAKRWAEITARSPYAHIYPEWQETYDEVVAKLRRASPSVVALKSDVASVESEEETGSDFRPSPFTLHTLRSEATNVVALPLAARPAVAAAALAAPPQPARVIAYHGWQRPLPEGGDIQESFTYHELNQMSLADKQRALLDVVYDDRVTHHTLDRLLAAAGRVKTDGSAD